ARRRERDLTIAVPQILQHRARHPDHHRERNALGEIGSRYPRERVSRFWGGRRHVVPSVGAVMRDGGIANSPARLAPRVAITRAYQEKGCFGERGLVSLLTHTQT